MAIEQYAKDRIRKLRKIFRNFLQLPPNYIGDNGCIRAASSFIARNQIAGDYLEFGVWNGYSFVVAYKSIVEQRKIVSKENYDDPEFERWKSQPPRFLAFDSFQGLPGGKSFERMVDYQEGAYSSSEDNFLANLRSNGVDLKDVVTVKGFYDQTLNDETKKKLKLSKAALIMIDCDLYESTVPVLDFVTDIIQQGTVIIFDDWFRFKGDPGFGEQRACKEWLEKWPHIELVEFWRQGPQAVSFIVNLKK